MLIRKPIVAGSFYPADKTSLKTTILSYLENVQSDFTSEYILGIISPHAGYMFSGQCAAYSYKIISQKKFKTAIIIAPSHNFSGFKFSVGNYDKYSTPLGKISVNKDLSEQLLSNPNFTFFSDAHNYEHSLEVQLPFLQMINDKFDIVPILFGNQNLENAYILSEILSDLVKDKLENIVFIVSSDLSHYNSSEVAEQKDKLLSKLIINRNEVKLWENYLRKNVEACGIGGILTIIILSKLLRYNNVVNLKYYNSGAINYDFSRVVGYLSSVFFK